MSDPYECAAPSVSSLTVDEALAGTTLRVSDEGEGTLADALAGRIDESRLRSTLVLDYHTEFDVSVLDFDGRSFESVLHEAIEYRFVEWQLHSAIYEMGRTGTTTDLSKLYATLERVARVDFHDEVDGGDGETVPFDAVIRDETGTSLLVVEFERGAEPSTAQSVDPFIDRASRVADREAALAAAFFVTTSTVSSDARAVASEATRDGLFSRTARRSFVTRSGDAGYHLCLVETGDGGFSLTVPDL